MRSSRKKGSPPVPGADSPSLHSKIPNAMIISWLKIIVTKRFEREVSNYIDKVETKPCGDAAFSLWTGCSGSYAFNRHYPELREVLSHLIKCPNDWFTPLLPVFSLVCSPHAGIWRVGGDTLFDPPQNVGQLLTQGGYRSHYSVKSAIFCELGCVHLYSICSGAIWTLYR